MSLKTVDYCGVSFPCSRRGKKVSDNFFEASMLIPRCGIPELAKLGRPANERVRDLWMKRFVDEMHWLPLVEVLIGCERWANAKENRAFLAALKAANPVRVCHRPWGKREGLSWSHRLRAHIQKTCPDQRIQGLVKKRLSEVANGGDVFFVSADCEPAATQSQTAQQMWIVNSWVYYRHMRIGSRPLTPAESTAVALGTLDDSDVAARAYKDAL